MRKSDRTRRAIFNSALEFLWTHPFRDLTIKELMSNTGISRSAFYQYFDDLHDLMEVLLQGIEDDIFAVASAWFEGEGDPVAVLDHSLTGLVNVCYRQGPILRAVVEAAPLDERLEKAWAKVLKDFDDAITDRIEEQQANGRIKPFEARPVAMALNRMDAALLIHHFGRRPRGDRKLVQKALLRVWVSTLYGEEALAKPEDIKRSRKHK